MGISKQIMMELQEEQRVEEDLDFLSYRYGDDWHKGEVFTEQQCVWCRENVSLGEAYYSSPTGKPHDSDQVCHIDCVDEIHYFDHMANKDD